MAIDYQRRPITVEEFYRMAEHGIIGPDERIELLEGELIVVPPMNQPHASGVARLNELFVTRLGTRVVVMPQLPIRLSEISEPLPDFSILLRRSDFYVEDRVTPRAAYALVECSDSSLSFDRGPKLNAYAKSGVAEYWIVNLPERQVEIHRKPHNLGYAERTVAKPGESVAFAGIPDVAFAVDELLGPALEFKGDDA
jgi:Uma2 family endonuclease